jgi:signal peptidase I
MNNSQIESAIINEGRGVFRTDGVSMQPLINSNQDLVLIESVKENLKKNDVALFKRKNGDLVLHRIVKVNSDGYIFRGDNQCFNEGPITDDMIIGVAKGFYRDEEFYSFDSSKYKRYLFFRKITYPFRKLKFNFLNLTNQI